MRKDAQTDTMKLMVAFPNFDKAPKNRHVLTQNASEHAQ